MARYSLAYIELVIDIRHGVLSPMLSKWKLCLILLWIFLCVVILI